jgi:hypothetical protein
MAAIAPRTAKAGERGSHTTRTTIAAVTSIGTGATITAIATISHQ